MDDNVDRVNISSHDVVDSDHNRINDLGYYDSDLSNHNDIDNVQNNIETMKERETEEADQDLMYIETYIGPYKEILKKFFDEGTKESSKKINTTMI